MSLITTNYRSFISLPCLTQWWFQPKKNLKERPLQQLRVWLCLQWSHGADSGIFKGSVTESVASRGKNPVGTGALA